MFRTRCFLPVLVGVAVVAVFAGVARAQTLSADMKELAGYRLTLPTVKKVAAVTKTLAEETAGAAATQAPAGGMSTDEALQKSFANVSAYVSRFSERLPTRAEVTAGLKSGKNLTGALIIEDDKTAVLNLIRQVQRPDGPGKIVYSSTTTTIAFAKEGGQWRVAE